MLIKVLCHRLIGGSLPVDNGKNGGLRPFHVGFAFLDMEVLTIFYTLHSCSGLLLNRLADLFYLT